MDDTVTLAMYKSIMDAGYLSQQTPFSEYPWITQSSAGRPWMPHIYHSRHLFRVSMDDTVTMATGKSSMDAGYPSQQASLSEYPWMIQLQWSSTGHPWMLDIYHSDPLIRLSMDDTVTIVIH